MSSLNAHGYEDVLDSCGRQARHFVQLRERMAVSPRGLNLPAELPTYFPGQC